MVAFEKNDAFDDVFESIYVKYNKQMFFIAFSILNNEQDAEDTVHDVFLNIVSKHLDTVVRIGSETDLRNYLLTATKNAAVNMQTRTRKGEILVSEDWRLDSYSDTMTTNFVDEICNQNKYDRVVEAIYLLDEKYRAALYFRFVLELSINETALVLGQSVDTTKKQVARGKKKLLMLLEEGEKKNEKRRS